MENMNNEMGFNPQPVGMHNNPQTAMPVNCDTVMQITSLGDLQSYAQGTVVRLPDFSDGQPFVVRMRRPSLLILAKKGKIPNTLLTTAGELFTKGGAGVSADENMLSNMYDIMEVICESALMQPTMTDIKNAGLELSDNQMMAIFNYTQAGIKALESFRKE